MDIHMLELLEALILAYRENMEARGFTRLAYPLTEEILEVVQDDIKDLKAGKGLATA